MLKAIIYLGLLLLCGLCLVSCGTATPAAPATPIPTPTRAPSPTASPTPTRTPSPTPRPTLTPRPTPTVSTVAPTPSNNWVEVNFLWVAASPGDSDDVDEVIRRLRDTPGIEGGFGSETSVSVTYDPTQVTLAQIQTLLAGMGYPVKQP